MKKRILSAVILLSLLLIALCSCQNANDDSFTVEYVGQVSIFNPTMFIAGTYKGESMKVDIRAFKDFADCDISTLEYLAKANVKFSATEDGFTRIEGGIRLTMTDTGNNEHVVEIKEGSRFTVAEKTADGVLLEFPDQ